MVLVKLKANSEEIRQCIEVTYTSDSCRPSLTSPELSYLEHLPNGHRTWALMELGPEWAAVMGQAHFATDRNNYIYPISQPVTRKIVKSPRIWAVVSRR